MEAVVSTADVVAQREIQEREARLVSLRSQLKAAVALPTKVQIQRQIELILQELAALKASVHYRKSSAKLASEIEAQKRVVAAWTARFKQAATRAAQLQVGRRLRQEAKELEQMMAAARLQQIKYGLSEPAVAAQEDTQEALAVEETTAQVIEFSPSGSATPASDAATAELDRWADEDVDMEEVNEPEWYKRPLVLVGLGVAAFLILR